jgi:hypothetical protein
VIVADSLRVVVRSGPSFRWLQRYRRGDRLTGSAVSSDQRGPQRECRAEAEGKIKGRGTVGRESPVCTWGRRDTRRSVERCHYGDIA